MDRVLKIYNIPRLNYEKIKSLNRTITRMENKSVIKNLSIKKTPGPDGFPG